MCLPISLILTLDELRKNAATVNQITLAPLDKCMLPNPHYESGLRELTGKDEAVVSYLRSHSEVDDMFNDIEKFISHWLKALVRDHRSYVTVAVGCTGGQHRSVYLVEALAKSFGQTWQTLKRHRELDALA